MARRGSNKATAIRKVEKRIVPVAEVPAYAKVLLYGRNGKEKTRTAANSGLKTLIIDVNEEGTRSVASYPNCYAITIKTWEEFVWVFWYLREGNHDFKVVIIDTLTQVQKICMRRVLNQAEDRDPNRPPNTPERRQWNQMTETLRPYIYDFRNLPMHVVFVCQERVDKASDDEDESGEIRARYVPDLSPGLRGDAMSAVGIMGRMYKRPIRTVVKKGKRKTEKIKWEARCLVGDHEDYETKDRTFELGYIVRQPSMKKFIEAWETNPPEEEE